MKSTVRGAPPAPTHDTPVPAYLERVFGDPALAARVQAIAEILQDTPEDAATALLAMLAQRETGWTRQILNAAGWLLINEITFTAEPDGPSAWEGRAAA